MFQCFCTILTFVHCCSGQPSSLSFCNLSYSHELPWLMMDFQSLHSKFSRQDSWRFQICLFEEIFVGMILIKIALNCIKNQSLKKNGQKVALMKISLNERLFLHLTNWSLRTTPLTAVVWSGITISASLEQVKTQLCFIVIQCLVRFLKWLTVAVGWGIWLILKGCSDLSEIVPPSILPSMNPPPSKPLAQKINFHLSGVSLQTCIQAV